MNDNDRISPSRLGLLLKKDILENRKKYLIHILVLYGALSLMFIWDSYMANQYSFYEGNVWLQYRSLGQSALMILFIFGCLAASLIMEPMNSKTKSISYLMQPSSVTEKFLSRWIILSLIYILVFVIIFWLSDITRLLFCSIKYPEMKTSLLIEMGNKLDIKYYSPEDSLMAFFVLPFFYTFIQSLFVLGSTFWPKSSALKTFAAGLILLAAFLLICGTIVSIAFEDGTKGFGNAWDLIAVKPLALSFGIIFAILTFVNWILAYFRFKESEIINRF